MKTILDLGSHTITELATSLEKYFNAKEMLVTTTESNDFVTMTASNNVSAFDKFAGGDEIRVTVELQRLPDNKIEIRTGNAELAGKASGLVLAGIATTVVMGPVAWILGGGLAATVVANAVKQASLPEQVMSFAKTMLAM